MTMGWFTSSYGWLAPGSARNPPRHDGTTSSRDWVSSDRDWNPSSRGIFASSLGFFWQIYYKFCQRQRYFRLTINDLTCLARLAAEKIMFPDGGGGC
jgi:hypothetical protein